ncbi:MAG: biotin-dependent carboxyltransferase family protein [Desulfobacterales bacterium]|jgi:antagonist of KipI|nr:biotin-dependent carboxyltransferase family protein [Desulfobacterales bacterium]
MAGVNTFEVLSPGIMSTVQDLGRFGCARYGVAASGALDGFAVRVGNLLVGNDENAAVLETTLMGLRVKVLRDTVVAVTGGDLQARKGSEPLAMWRSHLVGEGETIVFSGPASGIRAYLAVAGGIQAAVVMGSRSTNLSSGFGGFEGRPLRKGDILAVEPVQDAVRFAGRGFTPAAVPAYASPWRLRVIWGPQDDHFSEAGKQTFVSAAFTVSPDSDRTGIRLKGPVVARRPALEESIISEGILSGAIQVPGDGQPIIILGETASGGYRKIATVISADLPLLGQITPGDEVAFEAVSMDEAVQALREMENRIDRFKRSLE